MKEQQRMEALAAAFDQLPVLLVITEGDDERLVALNATARAALREPTIGQAMPGWVHDVPDYDVTLSPLSRGGTAPSAVLAVGVDAVGAADAGPTRRPTDDADLVLQFHDALLPKGLPVAHGVEVSARYLLADDRAGGDWFDAITLDDGRVAVSVGDVTGEGIEATTLMTELRTVFDERIRDGGDLGAAFGRLDRRVRRMSDPRIVTACAAILDPATGGFAYCTAGHPPPVVVDRAGNATYLPVSGAALLGSGADSFPVAAHHLDPGELVLLYSDGLLERPGRTPAQSTVELLRVAGDTVREPGPLGTDSADEQLVDRVCRRVLEVLTRRTGFVDDIAVLALQRVAPVPPLDLVLPAIPDTARVARAELAAWLSRLHVGTLDDLSVRHSVGELVANALEHAYDDPGVHDEVRLSAELRPDGVLEVRVDDDGRWREWSEDRPDRGRGLAMVRGFADELVLDRDGGGTRAVVRHHPTRPAALLRAVPTEPDRLPAGRRFSLDVEGTRLRPAGDLGRDAAAELRVALDRSSQGGTRPVEVDLAGVSLLGSAGIQVLLQARTDGEVRLIAPPGSAAQHVLELVQVPYDC
ncbi:SpoIIE family protein phosphatase [Nocardioides sp. YIM 152315]|uniref:SpoIIE family protein phosphatase n=1 Tax=Nocardioides sp. YIM 152315 TaxID=3031760 RepID=UPI0023DB1CA4|nr:SpoIIE family protein phosphatase [Nocardioides sp. YIM 152315]MDF1606239.1 SpoIIE family protein phosphatase [Nocardioides sp. YIM 152315]